MKRNYLGAARVHVSNFKIGKKLNILKLTFCPDNHFNMRIKHTKKNGIAMFRVVCLPTFSDFGIF